MMGGRIVSGFISYSKWKQTHENSNKADIYANINHMSTGNLSCKQKQRDKASRQ